MYFTVKLAWSHLFITQPQLRQILTSSHGKHVIINGCVVISHDGKANNQMTLKLPSCLVMLSLQRQGLIITYYVCCPESKWNIEKAGDMLGGNSGAHQHVSFILLAQKKQLYPCTIENSVYSRLSITTTIIIVISGHDDHSNHIITTEASRIHLPHDSPTKQHSKQDGTARDEAATPKP